MIQPMGPIWYFLSLNIMLQNNKLKAGIIEFFRFIDDGNMIIYIDFEYIKSFLTSVASYIEFIHSPILNLK